MKSIYGYKVAYKGKEKYIVTLEIPLENNQHNINRPDIVDSNYAKMRCEKARVLCIEKLLSGQIVSDNTVVYSDYDSEFKYIKGDVLSVSNFDSDITKVCAPGIHFYLTKEATFYHENCMQVGNWTFKDIDENGRLLESCDYFSNIKHGNYYYYSCNTVDAIVFKAFYNTGTIVGISSILVNNMLALTIDCSTTTYDITIYNDDGKTIWYNYGEKDEDKVLNFPKNAEKAILFAENSMIFSQSVLYLFGKLLMQIKNVRGM